MGLVGANPVPASVCAQQIIDALAWDRKWASAVRGQRLTD